MAPSDPADLPSAPRLDRLSALIARFEIEAVALAGPTGGIGDSPFPQADRGLWVIGADAGAPEAVALTAPEETPTGARAGAAVAFGGAEGPLNRALPVPLTLPVSGAPEMIAAAQLFVSEAAAARCGAPAALRRLAEVLLIQCLRRVIETGATDGGLLAGLADPRLARALTAVHDDPAQAWTAADLAREAGMSRSHFVEAFHRAVGEPPIRYVAGWRLSLARRDLAAGDRVAVVARRYGYGAPDAFSRAYARRYGRSPRQEGKENRENKDPAQSAQTPSSPPSSSRPHAG